MAKKKTSRLAQKSKEQKSVFVIMPFRRAWARTSKDLDSFFQDNLKRRIERERTLKCRYVVSRSDNTLDINEKIIRDIYDADIVICDLSGNPPNPNVMYELGLRFALGHKPVILIREDHPENTAVFDVQGLYTHGYSATRYRELEDHVIQKLHRFETGQEVFESPVLKAISKEPRIMETLLRRQVRGILKSIHEGFYACQELLRLRICDVIAAVANHEKQVCPQLPEQHCEILAYLRTVGPSLPDAFFEMVAFDPPPIPGLLGYLSTHPLMDFVPISVAEAFGHELHGFYFLYFGRGVLRREPGAASYIAFVSELARLHDCALNLETFVVEEREAERQQALNVSWSLLCGANGEPTA